MADDISYMLGVHYLSLQYRVHRDVHLCDRSYTGKNAAGKDETCNDGERMHCGAKRGVCILMGVSMTRQGRKDD